MVRLELGPIVSQARGRIGGQVFTAHRGQAVLRRFVPPSQPRTASQVAVRDLFRNGTAIWKFLRQFALSNGGIYASYAFHASGRKFDARNLFVGQFNRDLTGDANLADMSVTYPYPGIPQPTSVSVTGGTGTIAVAATSQAALPGQTLRGLGCYVIETLDPDAYTTYPELKGGGQQLAQSSPAAGTINFSGLASGSYYAYVFAQYTDDFQPSTSKKYRVLSTATGLAVTVT